MPDNHRITVVLGAGAVLELTPDGCSMPTTENITRSIVDNKPKTFDLDIKSNREITLLSDIYERLCRSYHQVGDGGLDPNAKGSAGKVHFEIIFHVLELLDTYNRSWSVTTHPKNTAPFAPFIKSDFEYNPNDLFVASRHLIARIMDKVTEYDIRFNEPKNDWFRKFWCGRHNQWDVFNFNYDTTIEQSLGQYEDGYEDIPDDGPFQRFNISKLLSNENQLSTVNHIHGCLLYGHDRYKDINHDAYDFESRDMYKWPDVKTARDKWEGMTSSPEYAQNGQTIIQGPIITGLSKTEKITCLPYDIYRFNLLRSIKENKGLLIAGYSFGDYYANHALYRMTQCHGEEKRVVLIDYWGIKSYFIAVEGDESEWKKLRLTPRIFEHYFTNGFGNDEELMFIKRIAHYDYPVWEHFDQLSCTGPMVSDNGQLMLFIGGMKDALSNYSKVIYGFLGV